MIVAYTHLGYIVAGWGITIGGIGAYAWATIRRGKRLSRQIPVEDRRWT